MLNSNNKKNILDLSKIEKPNLGFGVSVKRIESSNTKKINSGIKPRIPNKKKIKEARHNNGRVGFTYDIDSIWGTKRDSKFEYKKRSSSGKRIFIAIFVLFVIAAVTILGMYFFGNKKLNGEGVSLSIEGSDDIISGEGVNLKIKYKNNESVKVENISLRIDYPDGFHFITSDPYAKTLSLNVWELEDLKPGQSGEINLTSQIIGLKDQNIIINAVLSYEPANFSSTFDVKSQKTLKIKDSLMDISVEAPEEIGNNNRVTYNIKYKNISNNTLNNFRIRLDYPDNFTIIESNGDAKFSEKDIWIIDEIRKGEENNLQITGFIDLDAMTSSTVDIILEVKSISEELSIASNSIDSNWYPYITVNKDIMMSNVPIVLKVSSNSSDIDAPINWGDEIHYVIYYKNNTDKAINDAQISMKLDSDYLDWDSLKDDYGGEIKAEQKTITWDKSSIPSLAKLEKGQEAKIDFTIKLKAFESGFTNKNNYFVNSSSSLSYKDGTESKSVDSNILINKIKTPIEFSTNARYYDEYGKEVGSGPLPPEVGKSTKYEIVFNIKPVLSSIKGISVKTILPPGVDFVNGLIEDGQEIKFETATRQVIWNIDSIEAGKSTLAKFNVIITPDKSQIGKEITLVNAINLIATDVYSNSKINTTNTYLTTNLIGDKKAVGKDKVVEQ
ncbi:MAG: hypothetical protein PHZ07_04535 [Patescibacteria group bacterium]|nr:hypothetical protein [Patescibacteria group bacterium]